MRSTTSAGRLGGGASDARSHPEVGDAYRQEYYEGEAEDMGEVLEVGVTMELEIGSYDVNGSVRPLVAVLKPREYIGVDLRPGPGVDVVCDACSGALADRYGRFDIVIATETLEHVQSWPRFVREMKAPALYLLGGASNIVSADDQEQLRKTLPRVEIVTMPGLGHYPSDEKPAEFLAIVDRFLAGAGAGGGR